MDNKQLGSNVDWKNTAAIAGIIIFIFALIVLSSVIPDKQTQMSNSTQVSPYSFEGENNYNNTSPVSNTESLTEKNNLNFSQITQEDQNRLKEIFVGVIQNTIPVTQNLKDEVKNIFKKYNATQADIENFSNYGPAFASIYQGHFYFDALQAVSSGLPVKSEVRRTMEAEALSKGLFTPERIKLNDATMLSIANHQPVAGPNGSQIIFTSENINSTITNIGAMADRLQSLME